MTLINKQERFMRRNNIRIVGVKTSAEEDCLAAAKEIFAEVGLPEYKLERAHRSGKLVPGRERHILAKVAFFQDKVFIMKHARGALAEKSHFIIDYLTPVDLGNVDGTIKFRPCMRWAPS